MAQWPTRPWPCSQEEQTDDRHSATIALAALLQKRDHYGEVEGQMLPQQRRPQPLVKERKVPWRGGEQNDKWKWGDMVEVKKG